MLRTHGCNKIADEPGRADDANLNYALIVTVEDEEFRAPE